MWKPPMPVGVKGQWTYSSQHALVLTAGSEASQARHHYHETASSWAERLRKKMDMMLKELFNIVDRGSILKIVELWCLCCMMMFRWINKQLGIQKLWSLYGHYQEIYDWISPLNKRACLSFILTQQSMGRNE